MDEDFTEFVRSAQHRLLRYADLICGDRNRAEDLVQSALLRTYQAWKKEGPASPEAYARKVILHANVDWWRRQAWRERPHDDIPEVVSADNIQDSLARRDAVLTAMRTLTVKERAIVALRYLYGLSEKETAQEVGCPIGTVKSACARGLQKLRENPSLNPEVAQK